MISNTAFRSALVTSCANVEDPAEGLSQLERMCKTAQIELMHL